MDKAAETVKFDEKILPWEDIIICTPAPEETTREGIYLPDNETAASDPSKKPEKGVVYAIGKLSEKKKLPVDIEVGDMILYERYTANFIPVGNTTYNFIRIKNVMAVRKQIKKEEAK